MNNKLAVFELIAGVFFVMLAGIVSECRAESCMTAECHPGFEQLGNLHSPVAEGDCLACHEQRAQGHPAPEGSEFSLVEDGAKLCFQCHEPYGTEKVVHSPVAEGDCISCHQPHGSKGSFLLEVSGNLKPLCLECHDSESFEHEFGHGPSKAGYCTTCHSPHQAREKALLREKAQDLCLGCHMEFAEGMNKATFLHSAVVKQSCTSCHLPHSSKRLRLLNQEGQDLCFVCHKDIEADYKMSRSKHMALYTDNRCGNCHAVHFSELGKLLLDEEMPLCLKCHGHDDQSKSKPLRNIKKELEDKEYLHGPVADQQCIPCHSPHGSGYSKLMQGPYPGDFYAPFEQGIYDFCFECHESGMLTKREDASSTDFRNGDQNLHYLHVVKEQKGRTCQSCHATHASSGAKLISQEGVRFGSWEIPIRFNQTETGGSCTPGCHRKVDYDRESPVDYKADKKREE